ncbi:DNA-protecting protein DprA [bacterium]|nr:DNA-protecting protein DprA [bacterium]
MQHVTISAGDETFPSRLSDLKDMPEKLYCRGDVSALSARPLIAIVGKRQCTDFGAQSARELASFLTAHGYNVVSGLALGIDTAAHQGALEAEGQTVAVLYDIRRVQPAANAPLAEEILSTGGLLISENPPGTVYAARHLIRRNRIITALASAIFIIETDGQGGSVHTLRYARECGRPVFCIHPEELEQHSTPAYASGISRIVSEPGSWVYRTQQKDELLHSMDEALSGKWRNLSSRK